MTQEGKTALSSQLLSISCHQSGLHYIQSVCLHILQLKCSLCLLSKYVNYGGKFVNYLETVTLILQRDDRKGPFFGVTRCSAFCCYVIYLHSSDNNNTFIRPGRCFEMN